jgi:hypothetical protein
MRPMSVPTRSLAAVALLALAGCAGNPERDNALRASRAALEAKPACCQSSREFPFPRMRVPYELAFYVDRSAPAFAFPQGKSYFRSFELPPFEQPYVLELESRLMGGPTTADQWLFHPVLVFLDQDHRPFGVLRMQFRPLLDGRNVLGMGARMVIDERARRARFLVIHTEADAMSRSFEFGTVSMSMAQGAPQNRQYSVPYGYEGRLILRVRQGVPAAPQSGG